MDTDQPSYPQPPACNTGVATPTHPVATSPTYLVRLDYLACHIDVAVDEAVDKLMAELGCQHKRLARGMHGYSHCCEVMSGDDVWCRVFYSHEGTPFVQASGDNAQPVEDAIRRAKLPYRVTRKDAALDLYDAEWFPVLAEVGKAYAVAHDPQLKVEFAGDWLHRVKGRTLYIGARSSRFFIRLYEKGRKEGDDPNWIRCEVQYNPQDTLAQLAATEMTPAQIWCLRAYAIFGATIGVEPAELFDYVSDLPHVPRIRRDEVRARSAVCAQYGKVIERWIRDTGGDAEAFVSALLAGIEHERIVRNRRPGAEVHAPELSP